MSEKVLDKGHVDLVDHMGSDLMVCNAARVSFSKDTEWDIDEEAVARLRESGSSYHPEDVRKLSSRDGKLLKYLATHQLPSALWTGKAWGELATLTLDCPGSRRLQQQRECNSTRCSGPSTPQTSSQNTVPEKYLLDSAECQI